MTLSLNGSKQVLFIQKNTGAAREKTLFVDKGCFEMKGYSIKYINKGDGLANGLKFY